MCCHQEQTEEGRGGCRCAKDSRGEGRWLSRKKKAEALRECLADLESRAEDVREYLRELEA